jgi:hypothetical protein
VTGIFTLAMFTRVYNYLIPSLLDIFAAYSLCMLSLLKNKLTKQLSIKKIITSSYLVSV